LKLIQNVAISQEKGKIMGFWFSTMFDLSEKEKKAWQDIPEKQFWIKTSLLIGVAGLLLLVTFFLGAPTNN